MKLTLTDIAVSVSCFGWFYAQIIAVIHLSLFSTATEIHAHVCVSMDVYMYLYTHGKSSAPTTMHRPDFGLIGLVKVSFEDFTHQDRCFFGC